MRINLKNIIFRILTTVILLTLGGWTLYHNWLQRQVRFGNYTYSIDEAELLKNYPKAMYAHGLSAWARQDPETAERFFRQTVSKDILFIDGWLRLAEAEAEIGRQRKSQEHPDFHNRSYKARVSLEVAPDALGQRTRHG